MTSERLKFLDTVKITTLNVHNMYKRMFEIYVILLTMLTNASTIISYLVNFKQLRMGKSCTKEIKLNTNFCSLNL